MSVSPLGEGSIIYVGVNRAVVSTVYSTDRVEVVYLSGSGKSVAEDAVLRENKWQFACANADATYADRSPRLQPFVFLLRGGK